MDSRNFVLLPRADIGYIYNYIQTVVPFVYDESLDLYALLKKLIDYCNELGERNNELQHLMKKLVDYLNNELERQRQYINNFLSNLYQEWVDYKKELEDRYDNFTKEIDRLFEQYREWILQEYNREIDNIRTTNDRRYNELKTLVDTKIKELTDYANSIEPHIDSLIEEKTGILNGVLEEFRTTFNNYQTEINNKLNQYYQEFETTLNNYDREYENFRNTINNNQSQYNQNLEEQIQNKENELSTKLDNYKETLENELNTKSDEVKQRIINSTTEILNKLNTTNLTPLVETKIQELADSGELLELLDNLYGTVIYLYSINGTIPEEPIASTTPLYDYNETTHTLTDLSTLEEVNINSNSIYLYNGRVFIGEYAEPTYTYSEGIRNMFYYPSSAITDNEGRYLISDGGAVIDAETLEKVYDLGVVNSRYTKGIYGKMELILNIDTEEDWEYAEEHEWQAFKFVPKAKVYTFKDSNYDATPLYDIDLTQYLDEEMYILKDDMGMRDDMFRTAFRYDVTHNIYVIYIANTRLRIEETGEEYAKGYILIFDNEFNLISKSPELSTFIAKDLLIGADPSNILVTEFNRPYYIKVTISGVYTLELMFYLNNYDPATYVVPVSNSWLTHNMNNYLIGDMVDNFFLYLNTKSNNFRGLMGFGSNTIMNLVNDRIYLNKYVDEEHTLYSIEHNLKTGYSFTRKFTNLPEIEGKQYRHFYYWGHLVYVSTNGSGDRFMTQIKNQRLREIAYVRSGN